MCHTIHKICKKLLKNFVGKKMSKQIHSPSIVQGQRKNDTGCSVKIYSVFLTINVKK